MHQPVGAHQGVRVNAAHALQVGGAAAGFFHNDAERRQIPGHGSEVDGNFDGAFSDQHVLPIPAQGAAVTRRVHQAADFIAHHGSFLGARAGRENHGRVQRGGFRDVDFFSVAIRALPAISPPARAERRSAGHARYNFAILFDGQKRAKGGNAARKFFRAVDRIDDQACASGIAGR